MLLQFFNVKLRKCFVDNNISLDFPLIGGLTGYEIMTLFCIFG